MKRSGWRSTAMRKGKQAELPIVATQFDELLSSMGLSEQDAPRNEFMRMWIRQHHLRKFIPETVLAALGIAHQEGQ